jgi:hypothetical protein
VYVVGSHVGHRRKHRGLVSNIELRDSGHRQEVSGGVKEQLAVLEARRVS